MIEEIKEPMEILDERTERLISRRLDGELAGEDESLELDKQLIRSPAARRAFEESQRIDEMAGEMLRGLFGEGVQNSCADSGERPAQRPAATGSRRLPGVTGLQPGHAAAGRARWILRRFLDGAIGVAAAVLLIMVGTSILPANRNGLSNTTGASGSDEFAARSNTATIPEIASAVQAGSSSSTLLNQQTEPSFATVIAGPRRLQERIDQEVIGIVDPETQSILLLEMRTARNTISRMRANY